MPATDGGTTEASLGSCLSAVPGLRNLSQESRLQGAAMPVSTSAGTGQPPSRRARLADVNGLIDPAEPQDAERRFRTGGFVWLDLEDQGDRGLRAFSERLGIDDGALRVLTAVGRRPSFDVAGDSIHAVVPSSNWGDDTDDILGIRVMFTGRFLLTTPRALPGSRESTPRLG